MGTEFILPLLIAVIGSAGFWQVINMKEKYRREASNEYSNTLKEQVDRLAIKLDTYAEDKEHLLREIASLRAELASAQATIQHLEIQLRTR